MCGARHPRPCAVAPSGSWPAGPYTKATTKRTRRVGSPERRRRARGRGSAPQIMNPRPPARHAATRHRAKPRRPAREPRATRPAREGAGSPDLAARARSEEHVH
eukprot:1743918-Alexandrium_andersonii.AAC.1